MKEEYKKFHLAIYNLRCLLVKRLSRQLIYEPGVQGEMI